MPEPQEQVGVPPPELVAGWLALDVLVDPGRVPMWAAHWVAEGSDTPALVELAGLDGRDPYEVRELTVRALDEMGATLHDRAHAARLVLTYEAELCLAGRTNERELAAALDDLYVRSRYADEILRQPLGAGYGLDDEWRGGWGRTEDELRAAVRAACLRQIAARP
jgi:hypothetical protein